MFETHACSQVMVVFICAGLQPSDEDPPACAHHRNTKDNHLHAVEHIPLQQQHM
jgi:hypothetical protein